MNFDFLSFSIQVSMTEIMHLFLFFLCLKINVKKCSLKKIFLINSKYVFFLILLAQNSLINTFFNTKFIIMLDCFR